MTSIQEVHALAIDMLDQHGLSDWRIRWNNKAGDAGTTTYSTKTIALSARAIAYWDSPAATEALLIHELAHALVGPGHEHGKVWKKKVRELGGEPLEFCPRFSSDTARFTASLGSGENVWFLLMIVVGAFFVSPPIGITLALVWAAGAATVSARHGRSPLSDREREAIEFAVRN